ncbi:MAG: IgGFc-binding protein [Paludibacteraceae bacterium]|nr:IgGFc-binding protein [Paludibacteraceae bacterium]
MRKGNRKIRTAVVVVALLLGSIRGVWADNSQTVKTTEGNDFFVTWLLNGASQLTPAVDKELKLTLIASARQETDIILEYPNNATKNFHIPANGSITMNVEPNDVYVDLGTSQTEMKLHKGMRVYSKDKSKRFTLIATNKNGSTQSTSFDVTMVVPNEGLGQEYIIQTHENDYVASEFAIIGTDSTNITINLSNGTTKTPGGGEKSFKIGPKDIWLATAADESYDLSGTTICADKPIGVFFGHRNAIIPKEQALSNDHVVEQALPIESWGKEFVVPMLGGHLKEVYVEMTAGFDGTVISIQGGNDKLIKSSVSLNRGETYRGRLREGALYITANKPVEIYLYSTSGGYNTYEDEDFNQHRLGDPSSTIVNSTEQFVDTTIYTTYTLGEGGSDLAHYINIVTREPNDMQLDGTNIGSMFQTAGSNGLYYAVAQVGAGTHTLTNPKGFTGFAYGLNDGQMYLHSVGYNFVPYADSLFVATENVMSPTYLNEMERKDQGYYQRQWQEWPIGKGRWDTAYVCNNTEIEFLGQAAMDYIPRDKMQWEIFQFDFKTGKLKTKPTKVETINKDLLNKSQHSWKYTFKVENQDKIAPEKRDPYTDYRVDFEISRNHSICEDLDHSADTLHMIVRVLRAFKDTSTHVICMGDTLRFFKDTGVGQDGIYKRGAGEDSTSFVSAANTKFEQQYIKGEWQYFTRQYESLSGCDSIMTLKLFVCDTFRTVIDTTICENEILKFTKGDKFIGRTFSQVPNTDSVYYDTLTTKGCGCLQEVPTFKGCDSIIELHVHVCPIYRDTLVDTICTNGKFDIPYEWYRKDNSFVKDVYLTKADLGKTKYYSDTLITKGCSDCRNKRGGCDSIFVLQLYVPKYTHEIKTDRFCDATYNKGTHSKDYNDYADGIKAWGIKETEVWDSNNNTRISVNDIYKMKGGTTNTFIDSLTTINGCDSIFELRLTKDTMFIQKDTIHLPNNQSCTWHGNTYNGKNEYKDEKEGTTHVYYDDKKTTHSCDSIYELTIIISESFWFQDTPTLCDNDSDKFVFQDGKQYFKWENHKCGHASDTLILITPDEKKHLINVRDNLMTTSRPVPCDSVWELILTINPTYKRYDTLHLCDNQVITWNGFKYAGPKAATGTYEQQFEDKGTTTYEYDDVKNLGTICDSICHVHFYVHKTYEIKDPDVVICADSNFVWKGHSDKGHKIYNQATGEVVTFGKGKLWKNSTNTTFILEDRMKTETCSECPDHIGCDSIHILKLTVNPVYGPTTIDTTYCRQNGLPFKWQPDANNSKHIIEIYSDTTCYDTLRTKGCDCDSIFKLQLHIYDNLPKNYDTTLCQYADKFVMGTTGLTFSPQDSTAGTYVIATEVVDPTAKGCPYIETWKVTVLPYYPNVSYTDTVCQGVSGDVWTWTSPDGKTRKLWDKTKKRYIDGDKLPINKVGTFTYIDSLKTKQINDCDCDSVEIMTLVVVPSYTDKINKKQYNTNLTICDNDSVSWRGKLFVGNKFEQFHKTYNKTLYSRGVEIVEAGDYTDADTTRDKTALARRSQNLDCDSITFFALKLKVKPTSESTVYMNSCDENNHDDKDVWYKNLNNGEGGNLPHPHVTKTTVVDYYDTLRSENACGCDSVIHLVYTIFPTYYHEEIDHQCSDSIYVWNEEDFKDGKVYRNGKKVTKLTTSLPKGVAADTLVYIDSLTSINGCDSIEVLKLFVTRSYTFSETHNISSEGRLDWQGKTYIGEEYAGAKPAGAIVVTKDMEDEVNHHTRAYKGISCDSIYHLTLRLGNVFRDTTYACVCDNQTYDWHLTSPITGKDVVPYQGLTVEAGKTDTLYHECKTAMNYDSIYVLVLTGYQTYNITKKDTICQDLKGTTWEWTSKDGIRTLWDVKNKRHIDGNKLPIDKTGTFTYIDSMTTKGGCGCDSIETLLLTIVKSYTAELNKVTQTRTICDNDSVSWGGRLFVGDKFKQFNKTYDAKKYPRGVQTVSAGKHVDIDTIFDKTDLSRHTKTFDCDSLTFLTLTVATTSESTIYLESCDEIDHEEKDTYYKNLHNGEGGYLPRPHVNVITKVDYYDTLRSTNACGCDSVVHLVYTIYPTYHNELKDTLCSDSSYVWNEKDFKAGKVYRDGKKVTKLTTSLPKGVAADTLVYIDSLTSINGCDSIEVLKLFVTRSYSFSETLSISSEGRLDWQGKTYIGEEYAGAKPAGAIVVTGTLKDEVNHYTKAHKDIICDSIYHLTLKLGKVFRDTTYDFVCDNCKYDWHIKSPITGKDVVPDNAKGLQVDAGESITVYHECTTAMGYDSIFVLILKGYPTYHYETSDTVCQGTDVSWTNHDGSSVLYQDGKKVTSINATRYGWTKIEDRLTTTTLFTDPHGVHTRVSACDSIYVRNIYVSPVYDEVYNTKKVTDKDGMCSNSTYVWDSVLYVGNDYDSVSVPIVYPPMNGLDYNQVVHVKDVTLSHDTLYDQHPYTTYLGCDSIRFLQLYVSHAPFTQLYDTIGDNNTTWHFGHGANYHEASEFHVEDYTDNTRTPYTVFFIDTLTSKYGCDSIIWDSVCIMPSFRYVLDTMICANQRFDWRRWTELNHTHSQVLSDTIRSKYGSDEIYVLDMTLIPAFQEDAHVNLCKNDTLTWQKEKIFYSLGQFDGTIEYWERYERQDSHCDSIYHLSVDYYDYYHHTSPGSIRIDTICQYEDWHWTEKDGSEHTQALCDQFGNHYKSIPTDTTGLLILYDSLHTNSPCRCDSTFELHLFVKPSFRDYNTDNVICSNESIYWEQTKRYYTSDHGKDIYDTATYVNAYGCDSTYYFHVRVNPHYEFMLVDTVCADDGDFVWQNTSYADKMKEVWTADYPTTIRDIRNYTAMGGCDSIYRLELTILPINIDEWYDTICSSDTLHFNDKVLKSTGTYRDTLINKYGCNYYQILHLTVIPPTHVGIGEPIICADDSRFELPISPLGKMPIAYSILFDSVALAQGFENDYHVYIPDNDTILSIAMPYHPSPTEYTRPDHYSATIYFDNGICRDSTLMRFEFSFEPRYPSWIIEQHWNDQIAILIPSLNGGYEFSNYQWYCEDTMLVGETKPYLYQPHWLDRTAHYYVELTRPGDIHAYKTCPIVPQWRAQDPVTPTMPYISVVPTAVVKENPVVNILSINPGTYKLYSGSGHLIESGDILPDEHHAMEVRLPSVSGVYVFSLSETSGLSRSVKVIVE